MSEVRDIRARIARIGVTHRRVAAVAGYNPTAFSRYISGDGPPPQDFLERVHETIDALEHAEEAAEEARRRVLAEHAVHRRPQRHERRKGTGESPMRVRALAS